MHLVQFIVHTNSSYILTKFKWTSTYKAEFLACFKWTPDHGRSQPAAEARAKLVGATEASVFSSVKEMKTGEKLHRQNQANQLPKINERLPVFLLYFFYRNVNSSWD
jgi:hypothetical protein